MSLLPTVNARGLLAARPAAAAANEGYNYYATDDGILYRSNGSSWDVNSSGFTNPMTTAGDIIYGGASGTPTRLGIGTAAQVLKVNAGATAPEWAAESGGGDLAGKELDYVQITAPVSLTATVEASAHTIITGTSVAYDGSTVILIEFYCPYAEAEDTSGASVVILLYDGGTVLGRLALITNVAGAGLRMPVSVQRRLTPTAASHQYIIKAYTTVASANALISAGAGGTGTSLPAFMRITRVSS